MNAKFKITAGFTLVEMLIIVGILVLLTAGLTSWEAGIFRQNSSLQSSLLADQDARTALRDLIAALRSATQSDTGAYAIGVAASTSLTFYSDLAGDGTHDRLRYFLNGSDLKRGILQPSGSPLAYVEANETVSIVARNLASSSPTLFAYYDDNYTGSGSPLAFPVNIPSVRLVRVTLAIKNDQRDPEPAIYQSEVTIRSLKDNL